MDTVITNMKQKLLSPKLLGFKFWFKDSIPLPH